VHSLQSNRSKGSSSIVTAISSISKLSGNSNKKEEKTKKKKKKKVKKEIKKKIPPTITSDSSLFSYQSRESSHSTLKSDNSNLSFKSPRVRTKKMGITYDKKAER
jgi:putative protein kinase ArgK-like GTPase of G3E family